MKAFLSYFFGRGAEVEFSNFTFAHFAPILFAIGIILLTYRYRNRFQDSKRDMRVRYFMAFLLILSEFSYTWRLIAVPAPTICSWQSRRTPPRYWIYCLPTLCCGL